MNDSTRDDEAGRQAARELEGVVERTGRMVALRASVEDMKAGRVSPAEEMLDEMKRLLDRRDARGPWRG
jgi:hypothetical protein